MVEHTRIEYAAYFFNQFMQAVVGVMEENLKEEIEFWQFLIDCYVFLSFRPADLKYPGVRQGLIRNIPL